MTNNYLKLFIFTFAIITLQSTNNLWCVKSDSGLPIALIAMNDKNQNNLDAQLLEEIRKENDKKTIKKLHKDGADKNDDEEVVRSEDIFQEEIFYQKAYWAIQSCPNSSYALILHNHGDTQIREEDWQSYESYLESKKRNENKDL